MENLGLALSISGVGIVVLLLVLAILAGIVSLMTKFIVDKNEEEEAQDITESKPEIAKIEEPKTDLKLAAAIAVALARAQSEIFSSSDETTENELGTWGQFGLQRRLTQSSTIRRTR